MCGTFNNILTFKMIPINNTTTHHCNIKNNKIKWIILNAKCNILCICGDNTYEYKVLLTVGLWCKDIPLLKTNIIYLFIYLFPSYLLY